MSYDDLDTPEFKKAFWIWFDSISPEERKKFKEYPADMADIFYYNKFWSKRVKEQ